MAEETTDKKADEEALKAKEAAEEKNAAKMAADPKSKANKKRKEEKPEIFFIHSTVRDVSTRLLRAQAPGRQRFKQLLGGGLVRLVRKRPVPVAKPLLLKVLNECIEKEKLGVLKVTTPDGRRIDLATLKPAEEKKPEPPKPAPKQDSVEDDKSFEHGVGNKIPQVAGGLPEEATPDIPTAMRGMPEGVDAVPDGRDPEVTAEAVLAESVEDVAARLYDAHTRKQLDKIAVGLGLETDGNKMDVATRLAEAGYTG